MVWFGLVWFTVCLFLCDSPLLPEFLERRDLNIVIFAFAILSGVWKILNIYWMDGWEDEWIRR